MTSTTTPPLELRAIEVIERLGRKHHDADQPAVVSRTRLWPPRHYAPEAVEGPLYLRLQAQAEACAAGGGVIDVAAVPSTVRVLEPTGPSLPDREPRTWQRDPDLDTALQEAVPQAMLRDLHRVEKSFALQLTRSEPLRGDDSTAVRETMATRYSAVEWLGNVMALPQELQQLQESVATSDWSTLGKDRRTP